MTVDWVVYILECGDHSLYTGITNNIDKRLEAHQEGVASKYTRGRLPVKLIYRESCPTRSSALKREMMIKDMKRSDKQRLVESFASKR